MANMDNYRWQRHNSEKALQTGQLFANNLHQAKHFVVIDADVEKGKWFDKKTCSIMPIPDTDAYLTLEKLPIQRAKSK